MIFEIKTPEGDLFGDGNCGRGEGIYQVDGTGRLTFGNMVPGSTWVITEKEAPAGYVLNPEPQTVQLEDDITTVTIRNDQKPGLLLRKVDADTGKPVMGAKFTFTIPGMGTVYTRVSDNNGVIFLENLDVTAIVIQEVEPAPGYIANDTPMTVQLVPNERTDVTFKNTSKPGLRILKTDESGNPVDGVTIRVSREDGSVVGEYVTEDGMIFLPNLNAATYVLEEISCPPQFQLDTEKKIVTLEEGKIGQVTFVNKHRPSLEIVKLDSITKSPLAGVTFRISEVDGREIGQFQTDENGRILLTDGIQTGMRYEIQETATLPGYILDSEPREITLKAGESNVVYLENKAKSPLYILKTDKKNGDPIGGVTFRVEKASGEFIAEVTTSSTGYATVPQMEPGYVTVREISVPEGYTIDPIPKTILIEAGKPAVLHFENEPYGNLLIQKVDAQDSAPLSGARFRVETIDGTLIGEDFVTGPDGSVTIPNLRPGTAVKISEITAPAGYEISEPAKEAVIKSGETVSVIFRDKKLESLSILKTDPDGKPLAGAVFELHTTDGQLVTTVTSGENGLAIVPDIEGDFIVTEVRSPDGYILDPTPHPVHIEAGKPEQITVENDAIAGLKIIKTVEQTGEPLEGVTFRIEKPDGGLIGEYTTNDQGEIFVPLEPQTVVVREVAVPDGIQLDPTPHTVEIKANDVTKLPLKNIRLSEFTIYKTDPDGKPLAGAVFELRTTDGHLVTTVTSRENGLAIVPNLEGDFIVTEVRSPDGYILDPTPRPVHIEAGKPEQITVENNAIAGLKIIKTVEQTGEPLEGVTFRIEKPDGGLIVEYTTNDQGEIFVPLEPQTVIVREVAVPDGIQLDPTPRTVEIKANDVTKLPLKNERLNGIRIRKVDADTGKGIYGVRIMITDENNDVIGVYTTDQRGYIEIDKELPDGIYYLEEVSAAPGYDIDKVVKRIRIENGKTKVIVWENAREKGQIQILKTSTDANPITGQPAGSRLEGAVFEIARADTDLVVGYMVSDYRGIAASDPLPLGRYVVREVTPPPFFQLNSKEFEVELKVQNDVVRVEVQNASAQISTSVKKSGNTVVMPGQQMRYDFSDICNLSNVPLDSFFWHDELPSAVRLDVIHTGTWNQPGLSYSVTYRTNRNSSYRTLASGLLATQSYDLDCSAAKLGLAQDEYVTDFRFEFGTVQPGFREQDKPMILVTVLSGLTNSTRFANRTDAGGQYSGRWFSSSFTWVTEVSAPPQSYPKTGY